MARTNGNQRGLSAVDFEGLVQRYYTGLYQFALSLSHSEADACDLTQQTFYVWAVERLDWSTLVQYFAQIEERYRAPLVLFYLEDHSYAEIAEILAVPIGTVMSRLSRGRQKLQALLVPTRSPDVASPIRRQARAY